MVAPNIVRSRSLNVNERYDLVWHCVVSRAKRLAPALAGRKKRWFDRNFHAHLDMLLPIERLRGIQWIPDAGQRPPEAWLPLLARIRAAGKLCQVMVSPEGAQTIVRELGGRGFAFCILDYMDVDEAPQFLDMLAREDIGVATHDYFLTQPILESVEDVPPASTLHARQDELLDRLYDAILVGQAAVVSELIRDALHAALTPDHLLFNAMIPALEEVGRLFEMGDIFVPEMLIASRAMEEGMKQLRPLMREHGVQPLGRFVIGTVAGDIHDIGKNLVNIMLEGAGFEVIDLGVNVAPETFVAAIKQHQPDIVGVSAFLTTTLPALNSTLRAIDEAGLRERVSVVVGGAPVNEAYAEEIGADGFASDASKAVRLTKELLGIALQ
jgi:methylmalonyl-CoA mutase cobalamin-binding domain/chain